MEKSIVKNYIDLFSNLSPDNINEFDPNHISKIDRNISLIYRNYKKKIDENLIKKIKYFCKKKKIKFLLSNNFKLAIRLDLDGVYLPSFNKDFRHNNYLLKKEFIVLGSAHNLKEIKIKEKQGVKAIFISSLPALFSQCGHQRCSFSI